MNNLGVVAFCGSKGSGKSTSANLFKSLVKVETEELALAGHLKETASKVFEIDMKYFIEPQLKEVELKHYPVLDQDNIVEIMKEFDVLSLTDYASYGDSDFQLKLVRPHIGHIFETPRSLLQYIGSELLHPIDPQIHVKKVAKKKDRSKLTLITDLRFEKELLYLQETFKKDFLPIYVSNPDAEEKAKADGHPSEREMFCFFKRCEKLDNKEKSFSVLRKNLQTLVEKRLGNFI
jgi:energy-coupling factor transporter ATP-binding protein EcfA2